MRNWKLRVVNWTIWINMFLWLMAFGSVANPSKSQIDENFLKYIVGGGFLFSALLQHWAYYNLRKWVSESGHFNEVS